MLHTQGHRGCHNRGKQSLSCFIFSSNIIWFNNEILYDFPQRFGSKVAATFTYLITFNFSNMFFYYWSLDMSIQVYIFTIFQCLCDKNFCNSTLRINLNSHLLVLLFFTKWMVTWSKSESWIEQNNNFLIFSQNSVYFYKKL